MWHSLLKAFQWIKCLSSTALKIRNYLSNVHKIKGTHVQCMNNVFAKLDIKEWKLLNLLQITQTRHHLIILGCLSSRSAKKKKMKKKIMKCAKNKRWISSMFEQSICKVWIKRNENCWRYRLQKLGTPKVLETDRWTDVPANDHFGGYKLCGKNIMWPLILVA